MDNFPSRDERNQVSETTTHPGGHHPTLLAEAIEAEKKRGLICPNCGSDLEGRKCKLFCLRPGCGYQVTCSEWRAPKTGR